ncbi:3',5'-bisphosphate nucleotidase [Heterostelium album PN500]|uniref:3'(2'),5'-bisphosphate nucleotidase n=1 Tax=Heterostelium pallidum (strain ATCC 26659 / Pp 5 / PN500) TaxID=670386 RepID=D3BS22_HETP5|nr:3',5'-bisphosphate nucleotidase [Heterostelium album PN500]EFA75759.1 3',5'-bisphosphate nucleotidase [Heterostelium album PN500]|eukprot:XP_020427893.1 3',5'-bisphosphate nucleotidase [Heterostelium album PN500]
MLAISKLRSIAIKAVQQACIACVEIQSHLVNEETINKKDKSPVTVGDYTVQALVIESLLSSTQALGESEYSIVAEEDADTLAEQPDVQNKVLEYFNRYNASKPIDASRLSELLDKGKIKNPTTKRWWTLDPIDGTLGFLRRDQYAVALALMEDNKPILGILGCPSLPIASNTPNDKGCILIAQKGAGSFIRHIERDDEQPIHVSTQSDSSQAIFTESYVSRGFGHELNSKISKNLGVTRDPLRIDSQCKYAMVARGDSDIYLRLTELAYKECIWDHAAGHIIVEEAGGQVFDFQGKPLDYSVGRKLDNNIGIVCSNSNLYPALKESIKKSIDFKPHHYTFTLIFE